MKCTIFIGKWNEAQCAFNKWAKGKALTRDVIIHTLHTNVMYNTGETQICIFVYHPEGKEWDSTREEQTITSKDVGTIAELGL